MRKEILSLSLLFVLLIFTSCTTSGGKDIQQIIDELEEQENTFDDLYSDFEIDSYSDFDFYLSKTEVISSQEELERLQTDLISLQELSVTQRQLVESLQASKPTEETAEYLNIYTKTLDLYDLSFQNYTLGLENSEIALGYSSLDAEYDDLVEQVNTQWDDFAYYSDLDQYENASIQVDAILVDLERQLAILDEQDQLILFSFNNDFRQYVLLLQEYFLAADAEFDKKGVTEAKIYAAINDYIDKLNLFVFPTDAEIDEEFDLWIKDNLYNPLHAGDEFAQDANREWEDAEEYLEKDIDEELTFGRRVFQAPVEDQ